MTFNHFGFGLAMRIGLILLNLILFALAISSAQLLFTFILMGLILIGQVAELWHFVNHTNRELNKFFQAIRHEDYSVHFSGHGRGKSFQQLDQNFKELIEKLKQSRMGQQSQAELLQTVMENVKVGIIVVEEGGSVTFMNHNARELLQCPHFHNWEMFRKRKPSFAEALGDFNFGGRRLIQLDDREFYLDLEHLSLLGQRYHLISFSDLLNEIEQKEIEAWHKLIRILAHEVMNSVTPISSLSDTVYKMLSNAEGKPIAPGEFTADRIEDIREAMGTIVRRSRGMLSFVEEYRKLTKLPAPNLEVVSLAELLEDVIKLMKPQMAHATVQIKMELEQPKLAVKADRKMIEQVLINLISNSIYALEGKHDGLITLAANRNDEHTLLRVTDNGKGIPEELVNQIFIPFFSTRKNGSGIGLTLSKNIMKLHNGSITVQSREGEGTSFLLSFLN